MSAKRNGPTASGEAASTKLANFGTAHHTGDPAIIVRSGPGSSVGCSRCNAQVVVEERRRGNVTFPCHLLVHEPRCPYYGTGGNRAARRAQKRRRS